jgi:hypothetical protein
MAYGLSDVAGVFSLPPDTELGYDTWAEMSGMSPHHPLVGGHAGQPGYEGGQRQIAVAQAPATMAASAGAPPAAHWSQLFNLKGNPIGWVAIGVLLYYALNFVHFRGGVSAAVKAGK